MRSHRPDSRMPLAEMPVEVQASRQMRLIHSSADLVVRSAWAFHLSLGLNITPKNLYVSSGLIMVVLLDKG